MAVKLAFWASKRIFYDDITTHSQFTREFLVAESSRSYFIESSFQLLHFDSFHACSFILFENIDYHGTVMFKTY